MTTPRCDDCLHYLAYGDACCLHWDVEGNLASPPPERTCPEWAPEPEHLIHETIQPLGGVV